ncbi:PepSY-associated TM helix domain-containing protein [Pseudogemmobacter bohemicus]|uniref:PepSY-associated TM helix domain-containing protein n=1 Tax=Pseudogemmobacter bohemicus TaxID=2250708 RepID=UPI000DD47565|nr:PepSY-associated TM helix domain-containing protein [Pseudogemmobacter bohemicus]
MAGNNPMTETRGRSFWLRQFRLWHWVSAAISLAGMFLFAVTGLTLNNAGLFASRPETVELTAMLPADLRAEIAAMPEETDAPVPAAIAGWAAEEFRVSLTGRPTETTPDEVYIAMPRPGGDAWMAIDRASGDVTWSVSDGGWLAWLNDLHKGRNAGPVWAWFIDLLAVACIIFNRAVPASLFNGADYYHSGGPVLKQGEVPAILQTGEHVLSRAQVQQLNSGGGIGGTTDGGGYQPGKQIQNNINMTVNTPNADSFRKSQKQILADADRAGRRASRSND